MVSLQTEGYCLELNYIQLTILEKKILPPSKSLVDASDNFKTSIGQAIALTNDSVTYFYKTYTYLWNNEGH